MSNPARLVVARAFGDHAVGDVITDPTEIAAIWGGEQAPFVHALAPEKPSASRDEKIALPGA